MTDEQTPAPAAGDEVVQPEIDQITAPEVAESTEGQDDTQPADDDAKAAAEAETAEKSKSAERRERRKQRDQQLRDEAAQAKAEADRTQARLQELQQAAEKLPKPKQSDYTDYEEYQAELAAYHSVRQLDRREAEKLEAEAKQRFEQVKAIEAQQAQEVAQNWETQAAEAVTRYPDFDQVARNPSLPLGEDLAHMIAGSDVAADLAYHLGKNPEICGQVSKLSPMDMARAVGRLEAQLSAPKPKTTTTAPDPINPVRGGNSTVSKDPNEMDFHEFQAWEQAGGKF